MSAKKGFAAAAIFLGLNGMAEIVYALFIGCNEETPTGDCTNLVGWIGWPAGAWTQAEFVGFWFFLSIVAVIGAMVYDWD